MGKVIFIFYCVCLWTLFGCSSRGGELQGKDRMKWNNNQFAQAVAEALGKEKGELMPQDLDVIKEIEIIHNEDGEFLFMSDYDTSYTSRTYSYSAFYNLSDLIYFKNLNKLVFYRGEVKGLEVCNQLPQLNSICLFGNTSKEMLEEISKLQYVNELTIQFVGLDYSILSKMPNLEIIKMAEHSFYHYTKPLDNRSLMTLPKERILLDLEDVSEMNNYELASQYPNILKIGRIYIPEGGDITFLEKMDQLEKVDLIGVTDIESISKMVWLKDLSIQMTKGVSDFSSFAQLTQLERLFLKTDLDQDFSLHNIGAMKSLKELNLRGNCIYSLDGIERFEKLQIFTCENGLVEDISAIRSLRGSLETLSLSGNIITDLSALNSFENLQYLDLRYNEIYDILALKECTKLRYLDLYENPIRNISPIAGLPVLEELFLFHNQVRTETINITQWRHTLLSFPKLKFYSGLESEWIYENSSQVRAKSIYD